MEVLDNLHWQQLVLLLLGKIPETNTTAMIALALWAVQQQLMM